MWPFGELHVADATFQDAVKVMDMPKRTGVDDAAVLVVRDFQKPTSTSRLVEHLGVSATSLWNLMKPEETTDSGD